MENSAKFLYMAGGILIAVMIMSVGAYMFYTGAKMTSQYDIKLSDEELQAYNAEFEKYATDEYVWLANDIVTVINKIYDINKKVTEEGRSDFIKLNVYKGPVGVLEYYIDKETAMKKINKKGESKPYDLYEFIKSNTNIEYKNDDKIEYYSNKFSCSIKYKDNGKVDVINFKYVEKK